MKFPEGVKLLKGRALERMPAGWLVPDGEAQAERVDISGDELRGKDLYLWRCTGCGTQTLVSGAGGKLIDCGCPHDRPLPRVVVTIIRQEPRTK